MAEPTVTEVRVQLNADDAVAIAQQVSRSPEFRNRLVNVTVSWSVAILGVALLPNFMTGQRIAGAHWLVAGVSIAYIVFSNMRTLWPSKTNIWRWGRRQDASNYTVSIQPDGVTWRNPRQSTQIRWSAISKIEVDVDRMYLMVADGQNSAIVVPRRAFETDFTFNHFVETARSYWAMRPTSEKICPQCGYDLRGATIGGCPECGWQR
jgi:hypothetical protein